MDQREKINDFEELLRVAIGTLILDVMTSMPVRIVAWDQATMTVQAQPTANSQVRQKDGTTRWVPQSVLVRCPVLFFGGGGFTLTSPPAPGDEGIAYFSNRSIDDWWVAGGIQNRVDLRSHSVSDGFVLVGPRSLPNVLTNINSNGMEMRSNDGSTKLSVETSGIVRVTAPGGMSIQAEVSVTGDVTLTGVLTAAELATAQTAAASSTPADHAVPIVIGGVMYFMKLSATP